MTGPYVSVKKVWNKVGANEIKKTAVRERRRKGKREKEGNKKGERKRGKSEKKREKER